MASARSWRLPLSTLTKVDAEELQPNLDKMEAVVQAYRPCSVSEMKAYFGLFTYYADFSLICPLFWLHYTLCSSGTHL